MDLTDGASPRKGMCWKAFYEAFHAVLVTTKYIYVYKLQNTNCVNGRVTYKLNTLMIAFRIGIVKYRDEG